MRFVLLLLLLTAATAVYIASYTRLEDMPSCVVETSIVFHVPSEAIEGRLSGSDGGLVYDVQCQAPYHVYTRRETRQVPIGCDSGSAAWFLLERKSSEWQRLCRVSTYASQDALEPLSTHHITDSRIYVVAMPLTVQYATTGGLDYLEDRIAYDVPARKLHHFEQPFMFKVGLDIGPDGYPHCTTPGGSPVNRSSFPDELWRPDGDLCVLLRDYQIKKVDGVYHVSPRIWDIQLTLTLYSTSN